MRTKQEVINFLESKLGTKVPCKGNPSLDGQCVTLIKALLEFLGAPDPYKARGNANICISAYLKEGIADPGAGFLSVFSNKNMAGGVGHVWVNAGDGAGTYYESNGAVPLTVTKGKNYSYDNVCNLDKYIKEGGMPGDDYGVIVGKSTQRDEVVNHYKFEIGTAVPSELLVKIQDLVKAAEQRGYDKGFKAGKDSVPAPTPTPTPDEPPQNMTLSDGSTWRRNGMQRLPGGGLLGNYELTSKIKEG